MMEVSEAVAAVLREVSPFEPQAIPLLEALGLVLAVDIHADADSPHGGAFETSRLWYLRPDLVDSTAVRRAPDLPAQGAAAWARVAQRADWPGYVGSPRSATLELGEWLYQTQRRSCTELALRFLDGLDERTVARASDQQRAYPGVRALFDQQERTESDEGARQKRALARGASRP